jgi:S-adenosylmethionine hydrolase
MRIFNLYRTLERLEKEKYSVDAGGRKYKMRYYATYAEAPEDKLFLIEGSSGTLEISIKGGSANERIGTKAGEKIRIE